MMSFWVFGFLQLAASTSSEACIAAPVTRNGFDAFMYPYPLHDQQGFNPDGSMSREFYRGGYKDFGEKRQLGWFLKNIHIDGYPDHLGRGVLYGRTSNVANFTLEFKGFYKAPTNGEYTLKLTADDEMSVQIGEGRRDCCEELLQPEYYPFEAATKAPADFDASNKDSIRQTSLTVTLSEGLYYPVKMVYFNAGGHYMIQSSMVAPRGQADYYWGDNIYQFDPKWACPNMLIES